MAPLISVEEVAVLLKVAPKWVYRHVADGSLPHRKVGRKVRFDPGEIAAWLSRQPGTALNEDMEPSKRRRDDSEK